MGVWAGGGAVKENQKTITIVLCFLIAVAIYLVIAVLNGASSA